jgi:outer membrane autotransporter protein
LTGTEAAHTLNLIDMTVTGALQGAGGALDDDFALSADSQVSAGDYTYTLQRGATPQTANNLYLQSTRAAPAPADDAADAAESVPALSAWALAALALLLAGAAAAMRRYLSACEVNASAKNCSSGSPRCRV